MRVKGNEGLARNYLSVTGKQFEKLPELPGKVYNLYDRIRLFISSSIF